MKSFFGSNSRKETHGEWFCAPHRPAFIALQIYSEWHYANLFRRHLQVARHELGVVVTNRDERIDVFDIFSDQTEGFAAIWFVQQTGRPRASLIGFARPSNNE